MDHFKILHREITRNVQKLRIDRIFKNYFLYSFHVMESLIKFTKIPLKIHFSWIRSSMIFDGPNFSWNRSQKAAQILIRLPPSPELSDRRCNILNVLIVISHSAGERKSRIHNSSKIRVLVNQHQQDEL